IENIRHQLLDRIETARSRSACAPSRSPISSFTIPLPFAKDPLAIIRGADPNPAIKPLLTAGI
ncbi:MAG: hypothetical protein QF879_04040, partial [Candidatus Latescibacteria bacterium]|nr:hypothetical protein [Candidatus Latescibacterota bacterium]